TPGPTDAACAPSCAAAEGRSMAEVQIVLSHSRGSGIVAIATGEQYPWAHTALAQSGFQRDDDSVWHLPAHTPETGVVDLVTCAKRHRTSMHTKQPPVHWRRRPRPRAPPARPVAHLDRDLLAPCLAGRPGALDLGQRRTRSHPPE